MQWRHCFILTLFCALLSPQVTHADSPKKPDFLAVISPGIKPYNDVLKSFKEECRCTVNEVLIEDPSGQGLFREIYKQKPKAILAIGKGALRYFNNFTRLPVIHTMTLYPEIITKGKKNFAGVSMFLPPHEQLESIQEVSSKMKKIGLIYSSKTPSEFLAQANRFAELIDLKLVSRKVDKPEYFAATLTELKDSIDIFWMIPDTTIITAETIEQLFLFSLASKIPVTSFSKNFLNLGAFMSMNLDPSSIGRQTARLGQKVLSGKLPSGEYLEYPNVAEISINHAVAQKLDVQLNSKFAQIKKEDRIFSLFKYSEGASKNLQ